MRSKRYSEVKDTYLRKTISAKRAVIDIDVCEADRENEVSDFCDFK